MFVFALVFGALAVLGAAIGIGHIGHPINGQSIENYGWALFINGLAIAILSPCAVFLRRPGVRSDTNLDLCNRLSLPS